MASYTKLSKRDADLKDRIIRDPDTGKPDYFKLQARLIRVFGPQAGVMLRDFVYWTGRSKLPDGRFYKSRDEVEEGTGLGHRDQETARRIAKGEKERNGRTLRVLEEYRPSRRAPMHYRVDLEALATILGVAIEDSDLDAEDFEDELEDDFNVFWEDLEGAEPAPTGATLDAGDQ